MKKGPKTVAGSSPLIIHLSVGFRALDEQLGMFLPPSGNAFVALDACFAAFNYDHRPIAHQCVVNAGSPNRLCRKRVAPVRRLSSPIKRHPVQRHRRVRRRLFISRRWKRIPKIPHSKNRDSAYCIRRKIHSVYQN